MKIFFQIILAAIFFVIGIFFFINALLISVNERGFVMQITTTSLIVSFILSICFLLAFKAVVNKTV